MKILLWIYTTQMHRMMKHLYPNAVQVSDEVYSVIDNSFSETQDYVSDMCGRTFAVVE